MASTPHKITAEKLKSFSTADLETLKDNAKKKGATDVVQMCDNEIAQRPQRRVRPQREAQKHTESDIVAGYHFVCDQDRGVTDARDGRFWSGSWVVSEENVLESMKYGAYLAPHDTKSERSYRQGRIVDYRRAARSMVDKAETGIEFLVEATDDSYEWVGAGSGEKGYRWEKLARNVQDTKISGRE